MRTAVHQEKPRIHHHHVQSPEGFHSLYDSTRTDHGGAGRRGRRATRHGGTLHIRGGTCCLAVVHARKPKGQYCDLTLVFQHMKKYASVLVETSCGTLLFQIYLSRTSSFFLWWKCVVFYGFYVTNTETCYRMNEQRRKKIKCFNIYYVNNF